MIHDKRQFTIGLVLLAGFLGALALVFRPLENGQNTLDYLDGVFNSTSKASAYYIPVARERVRKLGAAPVSARIAAKGPRRASEAEALFRSAGASVAVEADRGHDVRAEHLGEQLAATVDHGRLLREVGRAVDHPEQFHQAKDVVERLEFLPQRR